MVDQDNSKIWTVQQALIRLSTPWLALIGERLQTPEGEEVDYWRIERADSAIVIPIWRQQLVLAAATYRPGIQEVTLDFPGGRIKPNQDPEYAAHQILQRELKLGSDQIQALTPLNRVGWPINSSLSNQRLYGFRAQLQDNLELDAEITHRRFPLSPQGIAQLLKVLPCLQCRAVLLDLQQQLRF